MRNTISNLNFSAFRKSEKFGFMESVISFTNGISNQGIQVFNKSLAEAVDEYKLAELKYKTQESKYQTKIADRTRRIDYQFANSYARVMSVFSLSEEEKNIFLDIMKVFITAGAVAHLNQVEVTGRINLVIGGLELIKDDVEKVGFKPLVDKLISSQQNFIDALENRESDKAEMPKGYLSEYLDKCLDAYNGLKANLEALAYQNDKDSIEAIQKINNYIDAVKLRFKQADGQNQNLDQQDVDNQEEILSLNC